MRLVVFPGVGNPDNYASVYSLIESGARERGYVTIEQPLRWPGTGDGDVLTLGRAEAVATKRLNELENSGEEFHILARSFGCYVALKIATDMRPTHLKRIMLWGPPPYWLMWAMWCRDIDINKIDAIVRGMAVDTALFPSLVPLECMLPNVKYETIVATGEHDPYAPHAYLVYLNSLLEKSDGKHIQFRKAVAGANHTVTEDAAEPVRRDYLRALFE